MESENNEILLNT